MIVYTPIEVHTYTYEIRNFFSLIRCFSNTTPCKVLCVVFRSGNKLKLVKYQRLFRIISEKLVTLIWPYSALCDRKWSARLLHVALHVAKETHIFKNETQTGLLSEHLMMSTLKCSIVKTTFNNNPDWINRVEEDSISKSEKSYENPWADGKIIYR